MIVAIDGPAGSGKSTTAHAIAKRCNLKFLDTGAMYRSVTYKCLADGIDVNDEEAVSKVAEAARIDFGRSAEGQTVLIDGQEVTHQIRTPEVDRNVSVVAAYPRVRHAMVERQRELGYTGDVVAEGRDIGTVVFPNAEVKVFLTADAAARAHRRAVQREGGDAGQDASAKADAAEEQQILRDLVRRDKLDSSRKESPLKPAADAHLIDNSGLAPDEVVQKIVDLMDEARSKSQAPVPAEPEAPAAAKAQEAAPAKKPAPKGATGEKNKPGKMRAFAGNTFDDYYDHGMREFPLPARALYAVAAAIVTFVTKVLWPWKIEDARKLWDDDRGRVVVMNHTSMLDPVIVICSLYYHGKRVRAIAKSEFYTNTFVSWVFSRAGTIPIKRGTADLKAVRRAQAALKRGEVVLIFPEGTRIKSDDQPVTIHGGFSLMAQMAKAPVQPMAIVGARDITPRGTHWKRFGRVFCKAGDCIEFSDLGVKGRKQQAQRMEEVAMERVYALRDELRQEHPNKK
ncbi:MAG: (d)CMP kinase [Coriobacteriaceae bacterium]|nr:MAG: (d)CMP kinase [Coriobacteriaceae bacterium]